MTETITELSKNNASASLKHFQSLLMHQLKAHSLLAVVCILSFISAIFVTNAFGQRMGMSAFPLIKTMFTAILPIAFGCSLLVIVTYLLFVKHSKNPIGQTINIYSRILRNPMRWAKGIPVIGFMFIGIVAFSELKPMIPFLNDYSWDVAFMKLDRALHFGYDPWKILKPIFGYTTPTLILDFLYMAWFVVMFGFWFVSATTAKDNGWERQFLLSFILVWMIGGVIIAAIFSSMGPTYFDLTNANNNPFSEQMMWLEKIHSQSQIHAIDTQAMLREAYLNPNNRGIAGISAMPSMHNATSAIFMMAAFKIHRLFGWIMATFLLAIVIGSVHLAWHYAVDAYAGIIIAIFFWWLAGTLIKWQDKVFKLT